MKQGEEPMCPQNPPPVMSVAGTEITIDYGQGAQSLPLGTIVRFYFNDAEQQLVGYLGQGTIVEVENIDTHVIEKVLEPMFIGAGYGVEPNSEVPANDWPVKVEVATDGVGEYWVNVVPTSDENVEGIVWTPDLFYNIESLVAS